MQKTDVRRANVADLRLAMGPAVGAMESPRMCCHGQVVVKHALSGLERLTIGLSMYDCPLWAVSVVGQPSERLESGTVVASGPPLSTTKTPRTVLPSLS